MLAGGKCPRESSDSCANTAKKMSPYRAEQRGAPSALLRGSQTAAEPRSIPGGLMSVALERRAGTARVMGPRTAGLCSSSWSVA